MRGVGGGCRRHGRFSGAGPSQAGAKVAAGTKGKSVDFKSPNLCSSAYTPINYNHKL